MSAGKKKRRRRRALLLDLDGTVRDTRSGRPHPVKSWDQIVREGVEERLRAYKRRRYAVVGVTNQGGVAFGYLTERDVEEIHACLTGALLPGLFDLVLYCPFHPRGRIEPYRLDHEDRKPAPGMAFRARDALGLDLSKSIMVGDMESDRQFARNAGIGRFFWAHEFFGPRAVPDAAVPPVERRARKPHRAKRPSAQRIARKRTARNGDHPHPRVTAVDRKPFPGEKRRR